MRVQLKVFNISLCYIKIIMLPQVPEIPQPNMYHSNKSGLFRSHLDLNETQQATEHTECRNQSNNILSELQAMLNIIKHFYTFHGVYKQYNPVIAATQKKTYLGMVVLVDYYSKTLISQIVSAILHILVKFDPPAITIYKQMQAYCHV